MLGTVLAAISIFPVLFMIGSMVPLNTAEKKSVIETCVTGLIIYLGMFEFIALPLMMMEEDLSHAMAICGSITIMLCVSSLFLNARKWIVQLSMRMSSFQFNFWIVVMTLLVVAACILAASNSSGNDGIATYIATIRTDLYTDSIGCFDPVTGMLRASFQRGSIIPRSPIIFEMMVRLFGADPVILIRTVIPVFVVAMTSMVTYRIGLRLFDMNKSKASCSVIIMILVLGFLIDTGSGSGKIFSGLGSTYLMVIVLFMPCVMLLALNFLESPRLFRTWFLLGLIYAAGACISEAALLYLPACALAFFIPALIANRKFKYAVRFFATMIIPGSLIIYRFLIENGMVDITIH